LHQAPAQQGAAMQGGDTIQMRDGSIDALLADSFCD